MSHTDRNHRLEPYDGRSHFCEYTESITACAIWIHHYCKLSTAGISQLPRRDLGSPGMVFAKSGSKYYKFLFHSHSHQPGHWITLEIKIGNSDFIAHGNLEAEFAQGTA